MPLPVLEEREWDQGLYDSAMYDMHRPGPAVPKPAQGGKVKPLGDQRPGPKVTRK